MIIKKADYAYYKELNRFIEKFSEADFKNLQIITKSLLFSLIPLHDTSSVFNEKCLSNLELHLELLE